MSYRVNMCFSTSHRSDTLEKIKGWSICSDRLRGAYALENKTSSFFEGNSKVKSVHPAYTIKQLLLNRFLLRRKVAIGSGRNYCQEVWSGRKVASTKKKFLSEGNRRTSQVNWPIAKSKASWTLSIRWIVLQSQSGVGRSKLTCEERSRSENIPQRL